MKDAVMEKVVERPIVPPQAPSDKDGLKFTVVLSPKQADGQFILLFNRMGEQVNECSTSHGFWEQGAPGTTDGERIALMHSELSECLEAIRTNNPADSHIPEFSGAEAELADVVIRVMDFAKQRNFRLAEAIIAKHKYNLGRPHKHGKNF